MTRTVFTVLIVLGYLIVTGRCLNNEHQSKDDSSVFCRSVTEGRANSSLSEAHCFYYHDEQSSWWEANTICEEEGNRLVKITSRSIDDYLQTQTAHKSNYGFWIGGIKRSRDEWGWSDGGKMLYDSFDIMASTVDQVLSFFTRAALCVQKYYHSWVQKSCHQLAPFMCESITRIPVTHGATESSKVKGQTIHSTIFPAEGYTASAGRLNHRGDRVSNIGITPVEKRKKAPGTDYGSRRHLFTHAIEVERQTSPKLVAPGYAEINATSIIDCTRFCTADTKCRLVNFCLKTRQCEIYHEYDAAVKGGVSSQSGCFVYVDMADDNIN